MVEQKRNNRIECVCEKKRVERHAKAEAKEN